MLSDTRDAPCAAAGPHMWHMCRMHRLYLELLISPKEGCSSARRSVHLSVEVWQRWQGQTAGCKRLLCLLGTLFRRPVFGVVSGGQWRGAADGQIGGR